MSDTGEFSPLNQAPAPVLSELAYAPPSMMTNFHEAWRLVRGSKITYHAGLTILFTALIFLAILQMITLDATHLDKNPLAKLVWSFFSQAATTVFSTGLFVIAIRRACGFSISIGMVFWPLSNPWALVWTTFLATIIIIFGFIFFILPGIYLGVAYWFAIPLVVDRGLSGFDALETSRVAVSKRWFHHFGTLTVASFILFLSALPLGLGMIWSIPWYYNLMGILYRNLFGIERLAAGEA